MKKLPPILLTLGLILLLLWLGVKDALVPFERTAIEQPVYTVGEVAATEGPAKDSRIVTFGPALWGTYPGARAFPDVAAARQYLQEENRRGKQWGIFRLSGDYALDTYEDDGVRRIARTLVVVERVEWP
ncbi:MAG: hypothetical protein ACE5ET_04540 [Gammaproteobacteria bacterium]